MSLIGHVTEVEVTSFLIVFAVGLITGLLGGYSFAWWRGRRTRG